MKAMILAAGLGTRLKPWTDHHPKALVPVGGVPMLQRVIEKLEVQGFNRFIINVHHFAEQIIDFVQSREWQSEILFSDERGRLLETGGGILYARDLLLSDDRPFLVHNADILSNADCGELVQTHQQSGAMATLLVSDRDSSRKLGFTHNMRLRCWKNLRTGEVKGTVVADSDLLAFSGIHVLSKASVELMGQMYEPGSKFGVMDFYLSVMQNYEIKGCKKEDLQLIDIGKPESLARANEIFG